MQNVFRVEFVDRSGWTLRQLPKWLTIFCLRIQGVRVHELHHIVTEILVKLPDAVEYTIVEVAWPLFQKLVTLVEGLYLGLIGLVLFLSNFEQRFGFETELVPKLIASPLNAVQSLFREHLKRAMGDLTFFYGVILASVGFSEVRHNNLYMALWAESARLQQRNLVLNASLINVSPCLYIIKSISDYGQRFEEFVAEGVFGALVNFIKSRDHMPFEEWIHLDNAGSCC